MHDLDGFVVYVLFEVVPLRTDMFGAVRHLVGGCHCYCRLVILIYFAHDVRLEFPHTRHVLGDFFY